MESDDAWDDAHGSTGKSVRFTWFASMIERGLATRAAGSTSALWIGFWWRHDSGWDWGSDATHKWVYLPEVSGERTMVSFVNSQLCFFDGNDYDLCTTDHPNISQTAWLNDATWHSYKIYAAPSANDIRIWYDGVELNWNGDNLNQSYCGSSFDSDWMAFGYQSRPNWGSGNKSYFDDCIIASTEEEVESFLGVGGSTPGPVVLFFTSDFEEGDFSEWHGTGGSSDFVVTASNPLAGTYSARAYMDADDNNDLYADLYVGARDGKDDIENLWVIFKSRFNTGYPFSSATTKMIIINLYDTAGPTKKGQLILYVHPDGNYRLQECQANPGGNCPGDATWSEFPQNEGLPLAPKTDTTTEMKVYIKLNTAGSSDGVYRLWIDDVLKAEYTGQDIRGNDDTVTIGKINISASTTDPPSGSGYQYWDDIQIISSTAPLPPTRLRKVE